MSPTTALGILIRVAAFGAILALVVFSSFQWGKEACRAAYEKANARIKGEHAETVHRADRAATERALDAQEKDLTNDEKIDEIVEAARSEQGADDLCLSADIVERLRELQ